MAKLDQLLGEDPELVPERSTFLHHATLLHYVGANGVENYRQKTRKNAVQVAEILLECNSVDLLLAKNLQVAIRQVTIIDVPGCKPEFHSLLGQHSYGNGTR